MSTSAGRHSLGVEGGGISPAQVFGHPGARSPELSERVEVAVNLIKDLSSLFEGKENNAGDQDEKGRSQEDFDGGEGSLILHCSGL